VAPKKCEAGKHLAGDPPQCQDCEIGKYREHWSRAIRCKGCPTGRYGVGGSASDKCSGLCPKGKYGQEGRCRGCPRGLVSQFDGLAKCGHCPPGSEPRGASVSTSCHMCTAGKFAAGNGSNCKNCLFGRYTATVGSGSCTMCPAGQMRGLFSKSQTQCDKCLAGKHSRPGARSCSGCSMGTYSDVQGTTVCKTCGDGKYSDKLGSVSCKLCAAGRYGWGNSTSALCSGPCAKGRWGHAGAKKPACSGSCRDGYSSEGFFAMRVATPMATEECAGPCPIGKYSPSKSGSHAACLHCIAGHYADETRSTVCKNCPIGKYNPESVGTYCDKCAVGQFQSADGAKCFATRSPTGAPTAPTTAPTLPPTGAPIRWGQSIGLPTLQPTYLDEVAGHEIVTSAPSAMPTAVPTSAPTVDPDCVWVGLQTVGQATSASDSRKACLGNYKQLQPRSRGRMPSFLNGHNALESLSRSFPRYNYARVYRMAVSGEDLAAGHCDGIDPSASGSTSVALAYLYFETGGIGWVVSHSLGRPPFLLQQSYDKGASVPGISMAMQLFEVTHWTRLQTSSGTRAPLEIAVSCEQDRHQSPKPTLAQLTPPHAPPTTASKPAPLPEGVVFAVFLDVTLHLQSLHSMLSPPRQRALRQAVAAAAGVKVRAVNR
jgi:hypothetical protein